MMTSLMSRMAGSGAIVAALSFGSAVLPMPALAQTTRQAEVIVYGTDPCPRSTDDEIVVCKRLPETQRFRLPPNQRPTGAPQTRNSWVNRSKVFANQGATGPMSCSAVGPAGYTGCALQEINQAAAERNETNQSDATPSK